MPYRKKILVVEDNALNREMLREILSGDYQVLEAANGEEGLCVLRAHKDSIALVLLDVMMPVMDGYTFLDRVREDAELSLIPVIVMTQGAEEADELTALAHGATDFVPKPYRPKILLHRIAALINLRETAAMVNQLQYDRLTGLYSREFFYQKVRDRLLEDPDTAYCIIGSNIENFKLVNDVFGAREGDRLLREVADIAKRMAGSTGFCGRFNADRFLCFQTSERVQEECRKIEALATFEKSKLLQTVAMKWGIYEITDRSVPVEKMCDRAMLAVDSIQRQYPKSIAVYDDSLRRKLMREQAITSAMETALQERQFAVYLQPKYSLQDNCMAGAEALVRWIHPEWGFMSPGEFIPLFEKNGFIPKLDLYVWEQVCIWLRTWKEKGYPLLPISVNMSRADVFRDDLADTLLGLAQKYGIDPACLHIEITESAYAENPGLIVKIVETLCKSGFVVEMDDFGSGYSSLNALGQMPLDVLKLDMKFVQNELSKPEEQSLLRDIVHMAHRVHLSVVAEGVETREQMNCLQEMGCDYAQGYFFAKPMPIAEFEERLKRLSPQGETVAPKTRRSEMFRNLLLVVDEDAAYRETVRKTFAGQYQVPQTESTQDALLCLQSAEAGSISAVLLSMTLPKEEIAAVMRALRQSSGSWDIPILATIPDSAWREELPPALDADDFLYKNHPLFDLRRRVERVVEVASFRRKERALRNIAGSDSLTGLYNRRGFRDAVDAIGEADLPVAVCLFDLDDLKKINDACGHAAGDRVLYAFSALLRQQIPSDAILCRYGGDEFVVILKRVQNAEAALCAAESVNRAFSAYGTEKGFSTACSVGIVLCGPGEKPSDEVLGRADGALYRAKRENKGGCCLA